jgi:hypothetical protein
VLIRLLAVQGLERPGVEREHQPLVGAGLELERHGLEVATAVDHLEREGEVNGLARGVEDVELELPDMGEVVVNLLANGRLEPAHLERGDLEGPLAGGEHLAHVLDETVVLCALDRPRGLDLEIIEHGEGIRQERARHLLQAGTVSCARGEAHEKGGGKHRGNRPKRLHLHLSVSC